MGTIQGLVLHVQEGTETGTNNWFHNSAAQASSHFGNPKAGPLDQWVDTADKAWAQSAGNPYWISVEHEGHSGDSLTPSQLENDAQLLAWLHTRYGVPVRVADSPSSFGLGWHGMGGAAWGGHPDCPGEPIKNARAAIVARAIQILTPNVAPKEDEPVLVLTDSRGQAGLRAGSDGYHFISGPEWTALNHLVAAGAPVKIVRADNVTYLDADHGVLYGLAK